MKFYGKIGYLMTVESKPGVWTEDLIERNYYGDLTRLSKSTQNESHLNDDIRISNTFSIVADQFAYDNFANMKYIEFMGVKWKIESIDASRPPRLELMTSGKYNSPE